MDVIPVHEIMWSHPEHARGGHDPAYTFGSAFVIDHFCPLPEVMPVGILRPRAEAPLREDM